MTAATLSTIALGALITILFAGAGLMTFGILNLIKQLEKDQ